jgi:hypothetical protein
MAGHLGQERVTTLNVTVWRIDIERGLIMVKGSVPGTEGTYVRIRDAVKAKANGDLPKPGAFRKAGEEKPKAAAEEAPAEETPVEAAAETPVEAAAETPAEAAAPEANEAPAAEAPAAEEAPKTEGEQ